jgi:hypothetical protein
MFMVVVIYQHPSAPSCLSVCLSIHPPWRTPLPLDRFPLNLILETFMRNCWENPN